MLLIARALVLLICGFVLSFLFSLVVIHCHCYFKSKEAMITLSFVLTCRLKRVMMMHVMLAHGILI